MKMKNKLPIILLILSLTACDNRKDIFKKTVKDSLFKLTLNNKKELELKDAIILDSAKLGKKYTLAFDIKTSQKAQILLSVSNPAKEVFIKKPISAKGTIDFIADQIGEYRLSFSVSDTYSETEVKYVSIICFNNLPPIAVLKTNLVGNRLQMDGSASYDRDAVYGGGITQYFFTITHENSTVGLYDLGEKWETTLSAGAYIVHLKVKDGEAPSQNENLAENGVWSEEVSEIIIVKP